MASLQELKHTDRIEDEVEGFQTIARLHSLPTGTPDCLTSLPLRLAQDWRLRGSFIELLRDLQRRDPDFSLQDALTVLILAVGGPTAWPNRRRALDEPIDLTAGFLASLGGWPGTDEEPITDLDNPPDHDPRLDLGHPPEHPPEAPEARDSNLGSSASQQAAGTPLSDAPAPGAALAEDAAANAQPDTLTLAMITQALARLERGTVDLRLHLDSIDQRLSRMEPLLESAPAQDLAPAHPQAGEPRPSPEEVVIAPATAAPSAGKEIAQPPERTAAAQAAPTSARTTELPAPATPPATDPTPDPALDRRRAPRRDRFAAAMELPGSRSELHLAAHELPPDIPDTQPAEVAEAPAKGVITPPAPLSAPQPEKIASTEPPPPAEAPRTPTAATPETNAAADPRRGAAAVPPPAVPAPATATQPPPATPAPVAPVAAAPAPALHTLQAVAAPSPAVEDPQLHSLADPKPGAITPRVNRSRSSSLAPFTFGGAVPAPSPEPADTRERAGRAPLYVGLVAVLLIALAAFLLLRGKPIPFLGQTVNTSPTQQNSPAAEGNPTPAATALTAQPDTGGSTSPRPLSGSSHDRSLTTHPGASPRPENEILTAPTFVPETVMQARLISSPRPLYPRIANVVGLEGTVTFEAIIARDGTVDGLTVLGGQHLLRDAAANAVRQWRYQPFLVHGNPVEVRTIIHVNVTPRQASDANEQ